MLLAVLCVLLLDDGPTAPPGTVLPNKDELVKKFRTEFLKWREPLDNYYRRQVFPGRKEGVLEVYVQMNGDYCKGYTKDNLGVEKLAILTPSRHFGVVRLPYGSEWKLHYDKSATAEDINNLKRRWAAVCQIYDYDNYRWGIDLLMTDPPEGKVVAVTAERFNEGPVYRFHFKSDRNGDVAMDVDPALSWAIVHAEVRHPSFRPGTHQDFVYTFEGKVNGRPALKRLQVRIVEKTEDGKLWALGEQSLDTVKFVEQTKYDPEEYTLDHYGIVVDEQSSSSFNYATMGLVAVAIAVLVIAFLRARRSRLSGA